MTTPTPETDASLLRYTGGDLVTFPSGINPVVDADFARKLERERDEALSKLESYSDAYAMLEMERDKLSNERDELKLKLAYLEAENQEHIQRDMQRTGEVEQLRKVADGLANAIREGNNHGYGLRIGDAALAAYNELPHVKKS